ncbi:MAG: hypothetical protein LBV77_05275 [Candidatus Adiutrix intracellularis]|jgi:hypothetical protein|nr:hypothetical protein [Candidatus Adiutrix intracellularis]
MKILLLHPESTQQPAAARLAANIQQSFPEGHALAVPTGADPSGADLILAVFSLKDGAFAPTVAAYRDLAGQRVAFIAILSGPVTFSRLTKTSWGVKKQFCGNEILGGYFSPTGADGINPDQSEVAKACIFALRLSAEKSAPLTPPLTINY